MSRPRIYDSFARLSARFQHHFGGDRYIWFPATSGGTTYTVRIACRQAEDRGQATDAAGLLTMDGGTITLHAEKADFPFVPNEQQIFRWGPATGSSPATTAGKWQITSVTDMEIFSHYVITARRAD